MKNLLTPAAAAAALAAATSSGRPLLIRLDYESGYGIGNTQDQRNGERADIVASMRWQFGVAGCAPPP